MTQPSPPAATAPSLFLSLIGVNIMVFMSTLDMSIVNVALPSLAAQLQTDFATVQWVVLSYVLVVAALLLLVSRLGDIHGKRGIFSAGLVLFTLASLLCGLAPNVEWLIAFRAFQGIGAAMSQALGIAIVTEIAPPSRRGRAIGLVGATVAMGLALGPSLGGLLIEFVGWRWIFLINVPLGVLAQWIIARFMPPLPPVKSGQRFDFPGAVLAALTLVAYSMGMTLGQKHGFDAHGTIGLLSIALIGLIAFATLERKVVQPMIDPALFANPLFTLNLIMSVIVFISLAGGFIMPFYLQLAQNRPPSEVGLLMMLLPLSMGVAAPFSGAMSDRFGPRGLSLLGLIIMAGGCLAVSALTLDSPWWEFALRIIPVGFGIGIFQAPNNSAIMGEVSKERLGVASGLLNYSRVFGQSTGLPLTGAIFTFFVTSMSMEPVHADLNAMAPAALVAGVTGVYRLQAVFILVAIGMGILAWVLDRKRSEKRKKTP